MDRYRKNVIEKNDKIEFLCVFKYEREKERERERDTAFEVAE